VFTNDRNPRATDPDLLGLQTSAPTAATLATTVRRGASIGANCTIGPGLVLGEFCMVGMGSVVTADVPPHALVLGNPARLHGLVCRCGDVVARAVAGAVPTGEHRCACGRAVRWPQA
jgi:tetrahydrodipicolinate N-succinyltransferase